MLTLNFTLPSDVDFVSVSGCTLPPSSTRSRRRRPAPSRTRFPFSHKQHVRTSVKSTITVARHFDPDAPVPTSCPTASLGDVTVQATTDVGDDVTASPAVTLGVKPYADIDVTATAPAQRQPGRHHLGPRHHQNSARARTPRPSRSTLETSSASGVNLADLRLDQRRLHRDRLGQSEDGVQTPTPGETAPA